MKLLHKSVLNGVEDLQLGMLWDLPAALRYGVLASLLN
jgi:hypothetical protein